MSDLASQLSKLSHSDASKGVISEVKDAPKVETADKKPFVDDTKDTVHSFLDKIAVAKSNGDEWVETSEDIIYHYNRNGLKGSKFFIFQGVKVCKKGELDNILNEDSVQMGQRMHGVGEGVVIGGR